MNSPICSHCAKSIRAETKFCSSCGKPIDRPTLLRLIGGRQLLRSEDYEPQFAWSPDGSKFAFTFGQNDKAQTLSVQNSFHLLADDLRLGNEELPINTKIGWDQENNIKVIGSQDQGKVWSQDEKSYCSIKDGWLMVDNGETLLKIEKVSCESSFVIGWDALGFASSTPSARRWTTSRGSRSSA